MSSFRHVSKVILPHFYPTIQGVNQDSFTPVEKSSIFQEMSDIFWRQLLAEFEGKVSRPNYVTWLKPTRFVENRGGLVIIAVPNPYAKNWLEKNALKDIRQALQEEFADFEDVRFEVMKNTDGADAEELPLLKNFLPEDAESPNAPSPISQFNSRYTFDNFIVGNNNRLAFAASQVVAEKPGEAYNPLFIYGGVGLGKTHLMHAIATDVLRRNPKKKILYISCETFASEFIQALQNRTINDFKKRYRSVDVLLVDDIQFLANKEGTQEEFFHTFNILHQANRQIVVTSDRVPKEITELEDRLVSRFGWGMIADIQVPNFENRVAILQAKASQQPVPVPQEVVEYIANTITQNVRELEGSLIKLVAAANIEGEPVTREFASRILKDLVRSVGSNVTTKQVIKTVAEYFKVEISDILGTKRLKELVYPRQLVMYFLREILHQSYPQIGEALGGKDHTTIMHGVSKIERTMKDDAAIEQDIKEIQQLLR